MTPFIHFLSYSWKSCFHSSSPPSLFPGLNIQHDANHGAISRRPMVNRALGASQNWIGGSAVSWIHQVRRAIQHNTFDVPATSRQCSGVEKISLKVIFRIESEIVFEILPCFIWMTRTSKPIYCSSSFGFSKCYQNKGKPSALTKNKCLKMSSFSTKPQHVVQHHLHTNDVHLDPDMAGGYVRLNPIRPLMKWVFF